MTWQWKEFPKSKRRVEQRKAEEDLISSIRDYDQQHAKQTVSDLKDVMREYYQVFGRKVQPLPLEPVLTDFYHPSEDQKRGEIAFIIGGTTLVSYLACSGIYNKWKS